MYLSSSFPLNLLFFVRVKKGERGGIGKKKRNPRHRNIIFWHLCRKMKNDKKYIKSTKWHWRLQLKCSYLSWALVWDCLWFMTCKVIHWNNMQMSMIWRQKTEQKKLKFSSSVCWALFTKLQCWWLTFDSGQWPQESCFCWFSGDNRTEPLN